MTDKELDKNFSSTNDRLEYFEHAPLSEWGFEYFKNRFIKTRRGTPRLGYTYSRYRLSLDNLLHIKELSADKKLLVANLIKELVSYIIFNLKSNQYFIHSFHFANRILSQKDVKSNSHTLV